MAFNTTEPRDLFYPNVLTPKMDLSPKGVQDAFRRVFDMLYSIQPPPGSRTPSTIFNTPNFIDEFNIKLDTNIVFLEGEIWNSSTAGVSWNEHYLFYHGERFTIAVGEPTTNKFIYWQSNNANNYQSSATFPTLDFVGEDGAVTGFLIAVWNASDGKLYPFWSAQMAPQFISTALIEDAAITTAKIQDLAVSTAKIANLSVTNAKINDLSVDKLTAGTLSVTATITGGQIRTGISGARIEIDNVNGFQAYNSSDTLISKIPLTGAENGNVQAPKFYSSGTSLLLYCGAGGTEIAITDASGAPASTIAFNTASVGRLDINSTLFNVKNVSFGVNGTAVVDTSRNITGNTITANTVFSGPGSSITSLSATNISSGTLSDSRLSSNVPLKNAANTFTETITLTSKNIVFTTGFGIENGGGESVSVDTNQIVDYVNSAQVFKTTGSSSSTVTNMWLLKNGTLTNVLVDTSDLGSGSKSYLYF